MLVTPVLGVGMLKSTNGTYMTFRVRDAYYGDMEGDGLKDDIHMLIDIHIEGISTRYNFNLYITLLLPSGESHTYAYSIKTKILDFTAQVIFYNHATESGWYTIHLLTILFSGKTTGDATDEYSFDPPGGNPGGDPHASFTLL